MDQKRTKKIFNQHRDGGLLAAWFRKALQRLGNQATLGSCSVFGPPSACKTGTSGQLTAEPVVRDLDVNLVVLQRRRRVLELAQQLAARQGRIPGAQVRNLGFGKRR